MGCSLSKRNQQQGANLRGINTPAADGGVAGGAAGGSAGDSRNVRVKLVLLGDSGVGKSCIVLRFVRGQFDSNSKVTVGAAFLSQTVALPDSTTVKFEIWDTAGQERYASLAPLYYRGASAAAVVYDITSPESFQKAIFWVKELQKHASSGIVIALVGNKSDLSGDRAVSREDAAAFAEENGMALNINTSAKTAENVNELFQEIASRMTNPTPGQQLPAQAGAGSGAGAQARAGN
mmetsp:Transcript_21392/g.53105  ORF Transcript_21392/g.53105 Transcript_21392/m.53105 type:complete len:235 (-) Transcript_21392:1659-2363(-)|eukprot:CAMPEP_0197581286 /NCGR_PEP_ID=MMETSP1326-20131121/4844_1 /TAXON_ID=1155430 /ORGANISM="Genus nov. species nov., Strain RCC2288" /LENGTH=234 /DNA_ID=CAMNT_0043145173 /DNA_START=209 /DNA_END=913 /DNA_ORIENTATION=-